MPPLPIRIIKLGGSLLEFDELVPRLWRWLAQQPPAVNVLVVGGGAVVEALRTADGIHDLGEEAAHWLAIRAMSVTAELAAKLLPEAQLKFRLEELDLAATDSQLVILDVLEFLQADQRGPSPLPASWEVTSDSIAACLAHRLHAAELVLLKSAAPPAPGDVEHLARAGFVDPHFPRVLGSLPLRIVNLRASS